MNFLEYTSGAGENQPPDQELRQCGKIPDLFGFSAIRPLCLHSGLLRVPTASVEP